MAVKTHRHCYLYTLSSAEHTSVHTNTGLHSIEVKQQRFSYIMYYNIENSPEYTKINWISNYRKQWLTWLMPTDRSFGGCNYLFLIHAQKHLSDIKAIEIHFNFHCIFCPDYMTLNNSSRENKVSTSFKGLHLMAPPSWCN